MTRRITGHLMSFSRRTLLKTSVLFGLPPALWAGGTENNSNILSQDEKDTLVEVARLLFPHKNLSPQSYEKVVHKLLGKKSHITLSTLRTGIKQLNAGKTKWLTLSEDRKTAAVERLENSEFFHLMRETSLTTLYRDPKVWQIIGYEGSAIEHGGYIHRGFNDLDWLANR